MIGGALFVVLLVLAIALPVPYLVLSPGPTFNTLGTDDHNRPLITIDGRTANHTSGHLNLTTVGISSDHVTAFQALYGWLRGDQVVVPRDAYFPPGQSQRQIEQQDLADFVQSQGNAQAAAFCELGYPHGFGVVRVTGDNAKGVLKPGDRIVSVAGKPADSAQKLTAILEQQTPGTTVPIVVIRSGATTTVQLKLTKAPDGGKGARIGITVADGCLAPYEVDLGLANEIGGPSAGLMFALGIMDLVGSKDLTGGKFIAGTGTIDGDGNVGAIGGIQLKMMAARRAGATVFLAPKSNCAEADKKTPRGLTVVSVSTLHEASQDLLAIQNGKPVPHC